MKTPLDPWLASWRQRAAGTAVGRFAASLRQDQLPDMAAKMAYYFMLSLFPGLILLVALLDALPIEQLLDQLRGDLQRLLPGPAFEVIHAYLTEFATRKPSGLLSLWSLAALWAASRGLADARKNLNQIFAAPPDRSGFHRRLVSFALTLAGLGSTGLAYLVLVGGPELGRALADWVGLGESFALEWNRLRWPAVLLLLTAFVTFAYRYLPSRRVAFRWLLLGAVPVVLGWIALGLGFRLYLSQAGNFDEIYGSLASIIVLLVFLWTFSLLLLLGGEIAAHAAGLRGRPAAAPPPPLPPPSPPSPAPPSHPGHEDHHLERQLDPSAPAAPPGPAAPPRPRPAVPAGDQGDR